MIKKILNKNLFFLCFFLTVSIHVYSQNSNREVKEILYGYWEFIPTDSTLNRFTGKPFTISKNRYVFFTSGMYMETNFSLPDSTGAIHRMTIQGTYKVRKKLHKWHFFPLLILRAKHITEQYPPSPGVTLSFIALSKKPNKASINIITPDEIELGFEIYKRVTLQKDSIK